MTTEHTHTRRDCGDQGQTHTAVEYLEMRVACSAAYFARCLWRLRPFDAQRPRLRAHMATQRRYRDELAAARAEETPPASASHACADAHRAWARRHAPHLLLDFHAVRL